MATSVIQKANARLKFLYRKRKLLNLTTKKLLVMSLIQCHFDYACSFWYLCILFYLCLTLRNGKISVHRIHLLPKIMTHIMCQVSLVVKYKWVTFEISIFRP